MTKWVLSPLARKELEGILDYIAGESASLEASEKVLTDFRTAFELIANNPNIGRKRRLTGSRNRWWRVHSYLLVYDPMSKPLRVLRIVHGVRDLTRIIRGTDNG